MRMHESTSWQKMRGKRHSHVTPGYHLAPCRGELNIASATSRFRAITLPAFCAGTIFPADSHLPASMPIQPHLNHLIAALHRRRWPAAVASGALLALAFPSHPDHPLAWLFAPLWGHLALVPLLCTLKGRGFKGGFANGWVAGAVWNLLCLHWVAHTQGGGPAVVAGTALMAAYLGLFPGLCTGLLAALGRAGVTAPCGWHQRCGPGRNICSRWASSVFPGCSWATARPRGRD